MKKIILSFLIMTMIGIVPAFCQVFENVMPEVQIEALSKKAIIKKAIGNLKKMTKKSYTGGNGQFTQIMEAGGSVIQLSREYGYYFANGYNQKIQNEWDGFWYLNFVPVYNARSLRYDISGQKVLPKNYDDTSEEYPWPNHYDARGKYMFDIIRLIYLYGPVYSRNWSDYTFTIIDVTPDTYLFSFESSDRYPLKNPLYAKGEIEIDAESMKLKSIRVENMGIHYAGLYSIYKTSLKRYPDYHDEKILHDCVDCCFGVDSDGEINYALIHMYWSPSTEQYYKGGRGHQPRPNLDGKDFMVTECWKTEPFKAIPDSIGSKMTGEPVNESKIMTFAHSMTYGLGKDSEHNSYNAKAIDKIKWALDVSDAERQLNSKMPIAEQYRLQSSDYAVTGDERTANGDSDWEPVPDEIIKARKQMHELIRNLLFRDPLQD